MMAKRGNTRTDRIVEQCFGTNKKFTKPVPQIRSQQNSWPVSSNKLKPIFLSSRSMPVPASGQKPIEQSSTQDVDQIRQSEHRFFANRELVKEILVSNREKELIESVEKRMTAFQQTLAEVWQRLEGKQIENTLNQCLQREFRNTFYKLNDELKKSEEENQLLKEEIARLRAIQVTIKDSVCQQNQWMTELKEQLVDNRPNCQSVDSMCASNDHSVERFHRLMDRIESFLVNCDGKDFLDVSDNETNESIDWFDDI